MIEMFQNQAAVLFAIICYSTLSKTAPAVMTLDSQQILNKVFSTEVKKQDFKLPPFDFRSYLSEIQLRKRRNADLTCPTGNQLGQGNHTIPGDRSISPYTSRRVDNRTLFPESVNQSACRCSGCVNAYSGSEVNAFESELIRVPVDFFLANQDSNERVRGIVNAGCTCVVPSSYMASS